MTMQNLVDTNLDNCVGCNRCTRVCPVEVASIAFLDSSKQIKIRVDPRACISCGACVAVCRHDARFFADDAERFFADLAAGEKLSVVVAPSLKTNFPEWRQLLSLLRNLGVELIYDVSLGADISTWAHLRYVEKYKPRSIITQPCPSVVSYIEKHRPSLLQYLSPVQSPISCLAVYLREYRGLTGRLAAITPCVAKSAEFNAIGIIDYNITFAHLMRYIKQNNIALPNEESDFDRDTSGLGASRPIAGDLKATLEYFFTQNGESFRVDSAAGAKLYKMLDEYEDTPPKARPTLLDGLNCEDGCNFGSAGMPDRNNFDVNAKVDSARREALFRSNLEQVREQYAQYDDALELERFLRSYSAAPYPHVEVTDKQLQAAFRKMGKTVKAKQNYDCGACGSDSCCETARKIALGVTIPQLCAVKVREEMQNATHKNDLQYKRTKKYITMINKIGDSLADVDVERGDEVIIESLTEIGQALNAASVQLWRFAEDEENPENSYADYAYGWSPNNMKLASRLQASQLPDWMPRLHNGEPIIIRHTTMNEIEAAIFSRNGIQTFLTVPISMNGKLWGMISTLHKRTKNFAEEEITLLSAAGVFIMTSIAEKEVTRSLIAAREDALAGARAKSDFLSRMSHEIRTPMNAIIGMTKIAESTDELERLRHCFANIDAASTHLLGILNDVLDMAKIDAGKLEFDKAPLDLERMLIKICSIVSDKMQEKHIDFNVILQNKIHLAYFGDEMRLSQVVTNLLSNAVKFTPEYGRVTIRVSEVAGHANGEVSTLRFLVEDTGIGIDEDGISRLFGAFEQANKGITQQFGGTGLGLSISKSIVEGMNGRIWVESEVGVGSKFSFEVDLECDVQKDPLRDHPNAADLSILIIDTSRTLRGLSNDDRMLQRGANRFDYVSTLQDTLRVLERENAAGMPIHVMAMDYSLDFVRDEYEQILAAANGAQPVILAPFDEWTAIEDKFRELGREIPRFCAKPMFLSSLFIALRLDTSESSGAGATAVAELDFSGKRLLLVEDIDINREIFITLLEDSGVEIDEAEDGRVGFECFRDNQDKYDIIVMDIQMPQLNGYEATRAIRALGTPQSQSVPIVAMTANAFREDIEACLAAGMNGHLMKPIDLDSLLSTLKEYLK